MKKTMYIFIIMMLLTVNVQAKPFGHKAIKGLVQKKMKESIRKQEKAMDKIVKDYHKQEQQQSIDLFSEHINDLTKEQLDKLEQLLKEYGLKERDEFIRYNQYNRIIEKIKDNNLTSWEHKKIQKYIIDPSYEDTPVNIKDHKILGNWLFRALGDEWQKFIEENENKTPEQIIRICPVMPGGNSIGL